MDPMESFGSVWRWLRKLDTSVVSCFIILHCFVIQMLDFELYRFDLDSIASLPQSIDLQASLRCVSAWLSGPSTSLVSCFIFLCLFVIHMLDLDIYRHDLDVAASTHGSNDPIQTFRVIPWWLHDSRASQVSHFDFFRLADVSRFEFDSSMSTSMPNVSVRMVWVSDGWLGRHR